MNDIQAENELIAEKLLGWKRWRRPDIAKTFWHVTSMDIRSTPTFTDWASAGLILEALYARGFNADLGAYPLAEPDLKWECGVCTPRGKSRIETNSVTGPLAIRSAALAYLRSVAPRERP